MATLQDKLNYANPNDLPAMLRYLRDDDDGTGFGDLLAGHTGSVSLLGAGATDSTNLVVGADLDRCHRATIGSSIFPAVQNLLLAATAHGLGSALTTISTVFADELAALSRMSAPTGKRRKWWLRHAERSVARPAGRP